MEKYSFSLPKVTITENGAYVDRYIELSFNLSQDANGDYVITNGMVGLGGGGEVYDKNNNDYVMVVYDGTPYVSFGNNKYNITNIINYKEYRPSNYGDSDVEHPAGIFWTQGTNVIKFSSNTFKRGVAIQLSSFKVYNQATFYDGIWNIGFETPSIITPTPMVMSHIKIDNNLITALPYTKINGEVKPVVLTKQN